MPMTPDMRTYNAVIERRSVCAEDKIIAIVDGAPPLPADRLIRFANILLDAARSRESAE